MDNLSNQLTLQQKEVQDQKNLEFAKLLKESKYFKQHQDIPFLDKKLQKLIEFGNIVTKEACSLLCELNAKSNIIYFLLEGTVSVFIRKNEKDLFEQLSIFVNMERCKKQAAIKDVSQELENLQEKWNVLQQHFDNQLLSQMVQYHSSIKSTLPQEQEHLPEKLKSLIFLSGSALSKEVCMMKKMSEIESVNCFGEIGAILEKPRTATIITKTPSTILMIPYKKYEEIFTKEQIYELNFRVLNLSEIFMTAKFGLEVVAHIASHFYEISPTSILYKEGEKVDGIYLIQYGHVEVLKTEKNYFNTQISLATKGKGSLIGIEDYFEFKNNQQPQRKKMELNSSNHSKRLFTVQIKELSMKIFKINKENLDYFVEGNALFKNYFVEMAFKQFCDFSEKYQNNIKLKHSVLNELSSKKFKLIETQKSQQPSKPTEKEQSSLQSQKTNKIDSQVDKTSLLSQQKNKQKIEFPVVMKYLNSNMKDFEQVFEITKKKTQRPSKKGNLTYGNINKSSIKDESFISHFEVQKQLFEELKKQSIAKREAEEDNELQNFKNIDDLSMHAQMNSLKFIKEIEKKDIHSIKIESEENSNKNGGKENENSSNIKRFNSLSNIIIRKRYDSKEQEGRGEDSNLNEVKRAQTMQKIEIKRDKDIQLPLIYSDSPDPVSEKEIMNKKIHFKRSNLNVSEFYNQNRNNNNDSLQFQGDGENDEQDVLSPMETPYESNQKNSEKLSLILPKIASSNLINQQTSKQTTTFSPLKRNPSLENSFHSKLSVFSSTKNQNSGNVSCILLHPMKLPSHQVQEIIPNYPSSPQIKILSNDNYYCSTQLFASKKNSIPADLSTSNLEQKGFLSKQISSTSFQSSIFENPIPSTTKVQKLKKIMSSIHIHHPDFKAEQFSQKQNNNSVDHSFHPSSSINIGAMHPKHSRFCSIDENDSDSQKQIISVEDSSKYIVQNQQKQNITNNPSLIINTNPSFPSNKISLRSPQKGNPLSKQWSSPSNASLIAKQCKNSYNYQSNLYSSKDSLNNHC